MIKHKIIYFALVALTSAVLLAACGDNVESENGSDNNSSNKDKAGSEELSKDDAFDVHGVKLKVKEEPEDIDKATTDSEEVGGGADFSLSFDRAKEIIKAINNRDEETLRKHNYFGDRIFDDELAQTVYMDIDEEDLKADDPMEEDKASTDQLDDLRQADFSHADEYINFSDRFEDETGLDFKEHINEIRPEGSSDIRPTLYRSDDIFKYAEYVGLKDLDMDKYQISTRDNDYDVSVDDGDYITFLIENKNDEKDFFKVSFHFDKYKEGYYYLNGVEIRG